MSAARKLYSALIVLLALLAATAADAQTVQRGSRHGNAPEARAAIALPLPAARISSRFGLRKHPILGITMMHEGVDLAAPEGTPIGSAAAGTVAEAGYDGGYGNFVRIRHAQGLETLYGHMSRLAAKTGALVDAGEVLGYVGSTGLANGPHLHFEVRRNGTPVDPLGSGAAEARRSVRQATPQVEVLRGGARQQASGGPTTGSASRVQVVRGTR